ncbi:MAG: adenosylcobinamide-GDP ribazoletransferase, partial [Lentilactobacillus hilgardii]
TGISLLFYKMTYAGEAPGLATIWQGIKTWRIGISQVVSLIAIGVLLGYPGLISYLAVLIVAYDYRRYMLALLGGFSGDTLGGFAEISQVIFLLAYVIVTKLM